MHFSINKPNPLNENESLNQIDSLNQLNTTDSQVTIRVGARSSNLSQAQVKEVLSLLQKFYPFVSFEPIFVKSTGDLRQDISLRSLDKTDFFTKEIDELVLAGTCRIGIHSAKDLPEPLPEGLKIVALTKGIDPSDSLVLRNGETIDSLSVGSIVATSSERREDAVRELRNDFSFVDIRGTIEMRIAKLDSKNVDGNYEIDAVVLAEAALIRLGLTHLNRITLPGTTTTNQGRLAVIARADDEEMFLLFRCIDS